MTSNFSRELDVEDILQGLLGKPNAEPGDWIAERRVERRHRVFS
jgi:hypothetical protein